MILTNNTSRKADQVDAANPRADNKFGHIIEMIAARRRSRGHEVPLGDPGAVRRSVGRGGRRNLQLGDHQGRLVRHAGQLRRRLRGPALDRDRRQFRPGTGRADGLWALETEGAARGTSKLFFRCPAAPSCAARCSRRTTRRCSWPSSIRATMGRMEGFGRPATFEIPSTRWPDFKAGMPPRPSVVAITKRGGGKIGT